MVAVRERKRGAKWAQKGVRWDRVMRCAGIDTKTLIDRSDSSRNEMKRRVEKENERQKGLKEGDNGY